MYRLFFACFFLALFTSCATTPHTQSRKCVAAETKVGSRIAPTVCPSEP